MALPILANTTCDIYRFGNAPPAAPDVAGVACHLQSAYEEGLEQGESLSAHLRYTHILSVGSADIRDDFAEFTLTALHRDTVYIPDRNGSAFFVNFVDSQGGGSAGAHKRVYLDRRLPTWPTTNL